MKKATILLSTSALILVFSNCYKKMTPATSSSATKTPAEEIAYAKTHYTDKQRTEGRAIFEKSCGTCHGLPVPSELTVQKMDDVLPGMFKKANLSYDDAGLVKAYMVANAKSAE